MNITEETMIGALVAEDYRSASVFKEYSIDFCCNGNRTIDQACKAKNIESIELIEKLQDALENKDAKTPDFNAWDLDLLADYIEKKHHRYVELKTAEIKPYLDKVCRVHGQHHPELLDINEQFTNSVAELSMHMKKEEMVLFPFIRKMEQAKQTKTHLEHPHFGTIENPINMMMHEHTAEGDRFRIIEELSDNYTPPLDACNTYRVTFALLKEFEADLHQHIHLENNILFPKAIELEKVVLN